MNINQKVAAFAKLQEKLISLDNDALDELAAKARSTNNWFTKESVQSAIDGLIKILDPESLTSWAAKYEIKDQQKNVGVVMAGNIPAVGFHDLLCVLISGNIAVVKLSSQDDVIIHFLLAELLKIEPEFESKIIIANQLKNIEAVIATGSDNTSRYFNFYFSKYPNIIRKNRTSCAVIKGDEDTADFQRLGTDIFLYYGLGCRNVSKLYVPEGYNFNLFYEGIASFEDIPHHHKYNNNYDYNKSIYLVNKEPHLDNGFLLLKSSSDMVSPISVIFYQEYSSTEHLTSLLNEQKEKVQCIVSKNKWWSNSLEFGQAQFPGVDDYADNVDTMQFLTTL